MASSRFGASVVNRGHSGIDGRLHVSPLATAHRRRPGLRTKTLIVTGAVAVATLLAMVFSGGVQL